MMDKIIKINVNIRVACMMIILFGSIFLALIVPDGLSWFFMLLGVGTVAFHIYTVSVGDKKFYTDVIDFNENFIKNSRITYDDYTFSDDGVRAIQVMINKYAELANMDNVTPHRFRHSFCKNLANAGIPIETISKLARHESIEVTKIYIDNSHQEMLSALEKM